MSLSRFTGHDFSEGIRKIIKAGDKPIEIEPENQKDLKKEVEIALFYRDLRRCWKKKDISGLLRWLFNYKGYWRFIPLYDRKILKKMYTEVKRDFKKLDVIHNK